MDKTLVYLKSKAKRFSIISESLENFKGHKKTFLEFRDGFDNLQSGFENMGLRWLIDEIIENNPISPINTTEFMSIHLYEFIRQFYDEDSPTEAILKILANAYSDERLERFGRQMTYKEVYSRLQKTEQRQERLYLLAELEEKAIQKTVNLLQSVVDWGADIVTSQQYSKHRNDVFLDTLANSVKTVKIYSLLIRQVALKEPTRLAIEAKVDAFPMLYSLTDIYLKGSISPRKRRNALAADSATATVRKSDLDITWQKLEEFLALYEYKDIKRPTEQIDNFCKSRTERVDFNSLFVKNGFQDQAVVKNCFLKVEYADHRKSLSDTDIRFVCLNLDEEGGNLYGTDIASMVEEAVTDAFQLLVEKNNYHTYRKKYLGKEIQPVKTVFYAFGDTMEDYNGESIGAASFCAGLSILGGRMLDEGIYFTGKADIARCNPTGVQHIMAKAAAVQMQPVPAEKSTNTLVMPQVNFENNFNRGEPINEIALNIKGYVGNRDLLDIWINYSFIQGRGKTLPPPASPQTQKKWLSDNAFAERNKNYQGQMINGLLFLISVMAPDEEIDFTIFRESLEKTFHPPENSLIDYGVLKDLILNSDGVLEESFGFLEERSIVDGEINSFTTNVNAQKWIRHHLSSDEQQSISAFFSALVENTISADPDGKIIPHIHEWINFTSDYQIAEPNKQKIIEDLAEFHINRFENELDSPKDTVLLNAYINRLIGVYNLLAEHTRNSRKNPDLSGPSISDEIVDYGIKAKYLTRDLYRFKTKIEKHQPESSNNAELIIRHFRKIQTIVEQNVMNSLSRFQLRYHSASWANLIDTENPDSLTRQVLEKYTAEREDINLQNPRNLAALIINFAGDLWADTLYRDEIKRREQYEKAKKFADDLIKK